MRLLAVFCLSCSTHGRSGQTSPPGAADATKGKAMDLIKAMTFGAILSATVALLIGSQGSSAGPLAIHAVHFADAKMYWSWPIFLSGSGLSFGIMLLQR